MSGNPQSSGTQALGPPLMGAPAPTQNSGQPMPMQFRPVVPAQPTQPFVPASSQQFRLLSLEIPAPNVGMPPSQTQQPQYSHPMQQLPPRPCRPFQGPPSSQAVPMPYIQPNRPVTSGLLQPQQNGQSVNNHLPGFSGGGPGMPFSSSYTFATSYGQPNSINPALQYQPFAQLHAPVNAQSWLAFGSQSVSQVTPVLQTGQESSVMAVNVPAASAISNSAAPSLSDWQEHTSADGRRYYYNKKTRQSSWEKPLELMTPIERSDASTVWKEFTTPEGRKYYYNKHTKQSKWVMPDELKMAREQAEKVAAQPAKSEPVTTSQAATALPQSEAPSTDSVSATSVIASSHVLVTPVVDVSNPSSSSGTPSVNAVSDTVTFSSLPLGATDAVGLYSLSSPMAPATSLPSANAISAGVPAVSVDPPAAANSNFETSIQSDVAHSADRATALDLEEVKKAMPVTGKLDVTPLEEKIVDEEPLVYASKQDAKNAFKALLESTNVESDWTWEQAMRVIINDKRYGALKTLGERKQAFHEYLGQRKKQEAEERRIRLKKAREDFMKMLEECTELTSSTRWSKAVTMFEDDERFTAVERERDREDLFESYLVDLRKKERGRALEEHKRYIMEYREFLRSCDFIKANSQWRKVQDRLEDDERCSRLGKIDRFENFQEYIRDSEKEEEEQRKIQKEQFRRAERKNRDEFRKLMEGHVADGFLTAKTHWRDYCMKVKELPAYIAVSSNTSGSTPKDLFEDVAEELEKQYHEDKKQIKAALNLGRVVISSSSSFENFKDAFAENDHFLTKSETNLKIIFDELLERLKEEKEKEAKKRQCLADDFSDLLYSSKEITASSKWEDSKQLFEDNSKYRAIADENFKKEIFEEYMIHLQEKAQQNERKREEEKVKKEKEREEKEKRKEKERKEKDGEREKEKGKERSRKEDTESDNIDVTDSYNTKEDRKIGKDRDKEKDRKHRKHHRSAANDASSGREEKESSKKSHRDTSDRKKSRKHGRNSESDGESRLKRHKRDRDCSRRGGYEELEEGEVGEDGEIR